MKNRHLATLVVYFMDLHRFMRYIYKFCLGSNRCIANIDGSSACQQYTTSSTNNNNIQIVKRCEIRRRNGCKTRTYEIDLLRDIEMFYVRISQVCLPSFFCCVHVSLHCTCRREWGQSDLNIVWFWMRDQIDPIQWQYVLELNVAWVWVLGMSIWIQIFSLGIRPCHRQTSVQRYSHSIRKCLAHSLALRSFTSREPCVPMCNVIKSFDSVEHQ